MKKCILLLLCLLLTISPLTVHAAAEDYRTWSQSDSRWASMIMGDDPAATVKDYGCASVSITKILRQSGAVPEGYTPRDFVNHMNTIGNYVMLPAESSGSIASWGKTDIPGIGLTYVTSKSDYGSSKKVAAAALDYVKDGYYVIVKGKVDGVTHFCAVDNAKTLKNGYMTLLNSWKSGTNNLNKKYTDIFDSISTLYLFTAKNTITYADIPNGIYYLRNTLKGTYITLSGGIDVNKQAVSLGAFDGSSAMQLAFTDSSTGIRIRPLASEARVLEPVREKAAVTSGDLLNIRAVSTTRASNQGWLFRPVSGGYVIRNVSNPDCVLSAVNGELKMQTYNAEKTQQVWELIPADQHTVDVSLEATLAEDDTITYTITPGSFTGEAILIAANYQNGRMTAVSKEPLTLTRDQLIDQISLEDTPHAVTLFLLDSDYVPLCSPCTPK